MKKDLRGEDNRLKMSANRNIPELITNLRLEVVKVSKMDSDMVTDFENTFAGMLMVLLMVFGHHLVSKKTFCDFRK